MFCGVVMVWDWIDAVHGLSFWFGFCLATLFYFLLWLCFVWVS